MTPGAEVSVIIQGPVHGRPEDPPEQQLTRRVIESVRLHYPGSEIILSTWKGSATAHLNADVVLENEDPGAVVFNRTDDWLSKSTNNMNRQLVSTQAGLRCATRRYAIKMRTDTLVLRPLDFEAITGSRPATNWAVLDGRVAVLNLYTRHPLKRPILFFLSDLFHAGLRTDLLRLWDVPLAEEPGFTWTIDPKRRPWLNALPPALYLFRAAPEQYLGEALCRRVDPAVRLRHYSEGRIGWLFLWLSVLATNIRILNLEQAGIQIPERMAKHSLEGDLFQPEDAASLEPWAKDSVPFGVRLRAAIQFQRVRWTYIRAELVRRMPPGIARAAHAIGRKLRRG